MKHELVFLDYSYGHKSVEHKTYGKCEYIFLTIECALKWLNCKQKYSYAIKYYVSLSIKFPFSIEC